MATKKIILLGAIGINVVYLLFAFANVNFNPKMWADSDPGLCAFLMGAVIMLTVVGIIINESSDR